MHTGPEAKEGASGPVVVQADRGETDPVPRLLAGLRAVDPALVLIFGTEGGRLTDLNARLGQALPTGCIIAGCASAGEIGLQGYASDSIVTIGFPARHFRAQGCVLPDLSGLPVSGWMSRLRALHRDFAGNPRRSMFGLLFSDGSAGAEDTLVATLDAALPSVPVLGGSAGNGLDPGSCVLMPDDAPLGNAAIFVLVETDLAVSQITFSHFSATETRAVVTAAIPERRRILELNAEPAAEEYARLTGIARDRLSPADFARHPLLLRMGRRHHVRAISAVTEDGGLSLMSAIDTGSILTLGRAEDLMQGMAEALAALPRAPLLVLAFDCILRRLALEREGLADQMSGLYASHRVAGFNTCGEQHSGMHVNQTFVGLAFMAPSETDDD